MEDVSPNIRAITVTKLNKYIKNLLEDDIVLKSIVVTGEISNLKIHSSGHFYFTLKDEKCQINAVMFKGYTNSIKFKLENGMKVSCVGYVSLYEPYGTFQFYVEMVFEDGVGSVAKRYEELKNKLEKQGYFEQKNKKTIPEYVKTVAVLTAKDGAAVKDIIRTIRRRNELIKIIVVPTIVQGVLSKDSIVNNINDINKYSLQNDNNVDVIILGRGGGSIEDMWSFNEEEVVKAIFNSKIPVISAVGHETDFTLSDFVADERASTPTAGAEIVSIPVYYLKDEIIDLRNSLNFNIDFNFKRKKEKLQSLLQRNVLRRPETLIINEQVKLETLTKAINKSMDLKLTVSKNELNHALTKLELLNPIKILSNGYTLTYKDKNLIKSSKDLKSNDEINIKFKDGDVKAVVK